MASPQLEDGFTRIANEILETTAAAKLTGTQYAIVLCVWRYTYGFNRKCCSLSISFIGKATGMSRRGIQYEINTLIERNILAVLHEPTFNKPREIMFQKDYTKWSILPQANQSATGEPECTSTGEPECTQERQIKDSIKKDMCKSGLTEPFQRFWDAYPKRRHKQEAFEIFKELNPDETLLTVIIESVKRQAASEEWQKNNGQYVPLPTTYLNGKRWADEITVIQPDELKLKRKLLNKNMGEDGT